ncbi:MAG: energy-coupled thiamine transporter ThiT [Clostridia bacterium]
MFMQLLSAENPLIAFTKDKTVLMLVYLTIALFVGALIVGLLVKKFSNEKFGDFKKTALGIAIGYAISVLVIMTYISFADTELGFAGGKAIVPLLFYPILTMLIVAVAGGLAMWIASLFSKKAVKIVGITTAFAEAGAFVATMICMSKFYSIISKDPAYADETWLDFATVNTTGLIVAAVIIMVVLAVFFLLGSKHKDENNTKSLVYGAIAIAMSFALSYIKFLELGQGGSITFASLLPLIIYCCMFGTRRGIVVCLIYGVLQAIQDPFIIHPMQFLLDYPLAFGLIGVSGIFMEKGLFKKHKVVAFILGAVLAVLLRYSCHVCSGIFAFASYANIEKYGTAIAYSFAYNSFSLVDMLISIVAGSALFASRAFTKQMSVAGSVSLASASASDRVLNDADDDDETPTVEISATNQTAENNTQTNN